MTEESFWNRRCLYAQMIPRHRQSVAELRLSGLHLTEDRSRNTFPISLAPIDWHK